MMTTSLLLAALCLPPQDDGFNVVAPAAVQLDEKKLGEIDELMSREVKAGRIVGCLALVARGNDVAYFRTWGQRDREADLPMSANTIFRIYSMSKPVTSVATMQLVEAGKLKLDAPVSDYLPELAQQKVLVEDSEDVPADREMTVRDLLRHTSGLTYGFFGNTPVDQAYRRAGVLVTDPTIAATVKKLGKLPLLYQPGTRWHYSVSTDVLGRLVEVASGERFDEYLKKHIFDPLGMEDTFFMVPKAKQARFAQMYKGNGNALEVANRFSSVRFLNPDNEFFSGGGGLCSTTGDYLTFCRALLAGGELDGQRIIKQETLQQMTRNQLGQIGGRGFQFGLGFRITDEGEYSWGGAAGTRFWINPKRNLIGLYMIQINPYGARSYGNQMKRLVYEADRRPKNDGNAAATKP